MSELTLLLFRIGFLVALWVFVFFVVFVIRTDLFGTRVKKLPATQSVANKEASVFLTSSAASAVTSTSPRVQNRPPASAASMSLVITSGSNAGATLSLSGDAISIGRSSDSTVVIRDDYTSTHHARLEQRSGIWVVSDMGSTNGTFVNGKRVTDPVPLSVGSVITVGETTFEVRG